MSQSKSTPLDDDHGSSIPRLMVLKGQWLGSDGSRIPPLQANDSLAVVSIGFLVEGQADAVIWRSLLKSGVIRQFLSDTARGDFDSLVIDCPPGAGDQGPSARAFLGIVGAMVDTGA